MASLNVYAVVLISRYALTTQAYLALITPSIPRPRSHTTCPPSSKCAFTNLSWRSPWARRDLCTSCSVTPVIAPPHRCSNPARWSLFVSGSVPAKLATVRKPRSMRRQLLLTLQRWDALFDGPSQVSRHLHDARMRPHDPTLSYCHGCQ